MKSLFMNIGVITLIIITAILFILLEHGFMYAIFCIPPAYTFLAESLRYPLEKKEKNLKRQIEKG